MTAFEIFGLLFLVLGGTQSLVSIIFRKNPLSYLFLFLGVLLIITGIWMMNLGGTV